MKFITRWLKPTKMTIIESDDKEFIGGSDIKIGEGDANIEDSDSSESEVQEHHKRKRCCVKPDVAVVGKIFEFCDVKYKAQKEFEYHVEKYLRNYKWVAIKAEKIYPTKSKCTIRYCIWFALLDYEKAFEIEIELQKLYRRLLLEY